MEHAAGRDAADGAGELQGRDRDGSLADADRDGLSGEPLVVVVVLLPVGGGHDAGRFVG